MKKGFVQIKLDVKKGRIAHAKIFGDFFGEGDVTELEYALEGVLHQKQAIQEALESYDFYYYFGDIAKEDIINLMV